MDYPKVRDDTVEPRLYNRLLGRLLGLPVLSLALLALILGYGLQHVERSALWVDHSDRVIAHANDLTKLMVDEETGLRGFLLTADPAFLEPFHAADERLDGEFATLFDLVNDRPDQVARLQRLKATHERWEEDARREIDSRPGRADMKTAMLARKQIMDGLRAQAGEFLRVEEGVRAQRSTTAVEGKRAALAAMVVLAGLVAWLLVWDTRRVFWRLAALYNSQLEATRLRAEESFAREQWLSTTLRSIGDAVIACDPEGRIVFMNLIAEKLTGWGEAEARGLPLQDVFRIFNEETREAVESPVDKVRLLGTVVGLANHTFLVAKDESEICIDDSGAPIRDSQGQMIGIVLVFRDITERRMSEGALMRAEKLATAGRMAASVAHEVNNPLEGLTNLIYIARRSDDMEEVRQLLMQADGELGRVAHITRQSLGFYRESTISAHFKPATVVREVANFYSSRAALQGVLLVVNTNTDIEVLGKAGEIRQILSNLIANSLDACPAGSTIRIEANSGIDPRNPARTGVRISVGDTGQGIRREHLKSIFEPFFTTKKDTGTGLGLWVSRELVEKHGGSLRVRSSTRNPRCGTVFSLFLPGVQGVAHENEAVGGQASLPNGHA